MARYRRIAFIILAHCTIGIAQTEQFIIRNHFETESGIGIQGILPTGDVTIVKCGGECLDEYYLYADAAFRFKVVDRKSTRLNSSH